MIPKDEFRIVFMGTPEFAVESLKKLLEQKYHVVGVVTNPDKPAGRGRQLRESPVKVFARENNLPLLQPDNLKDENFARQLEDLNPSLQVVVAFKILPPRIFTIPRHGTFNLHASLLPDYRGAAPINHAIINGEKKTGVTTFFLDPKVDTGSIIKWKETNIKDHDNAGVLHDRLMKLGAELVVETAEAIRNEKYETIPQHRLIKDDGAPKQAPKIFKEDCRIDWTQSAQKTHNFIRGLSPYPAAWTRMSDSDTISLKIFRARPQKASHDHPCGSIHTDHKSKLKVAVADGFILLDEVQQSGKKKMSTEDFLKGFRKVDDYMCE
ncbi:MAG TPA: methionyl-tRNA formyltransferase [Bacteroidales bacterium]|nr:methionyl-tRNA formyltransferase [Bacteroidales bacterium]